MCTPRRDARENEPRLEELLTGLLCGESQGFVGRPPCLFQQPAGEAVPQTRFVELPGLVFVRVHGDVASKST